MAIHRAKMSCRALIISCAGLLALPLAPLAGAADARVDVDGVSLPNLNGVWLRPDGAWFLFDPDARTPMDLKPPYKPEWQREFDAYRNEVQKTGVNTLDPTAGCLPPGMPRMMSNLYPMEILMTPGQVTIIGEWMGQIRRVYTDGRPHPEDPDITYVGHSIGHWEGDTLVIDTVAMRGDTMLDQSGMKHSDQSHVIERFRLLDGNTLEMQLTLDDSGAFTKPWTVKRTVLRSQILNDEIKEFVCLDNNRNPIMPDGSVGVVLPGDK